MIPYPFVRAGDSHRHSLEVLLDLYEHDDFMGSIGSVLDLGCGDGADLEWWATRTTRDPVPQPLNIKCTGVDLMPSMSMASRYPNITYQPGDFEQAIVTGSRKYDVLWCHDAFQYVIDPFRTLRQWRESCHENGMLILILPQSTNLEFNVQAFDQRDKCYWHWTLVNLMHVLAVSGWNCREGFFKKDPGDIWIKAIVYRDKQQPRDPRQTSWYELASAGLLPESACNSINRHGYLRQRDLILPWLDKSLHHFGVQ